ncbi:MAG TPA: hypothetical protein VJN94_09635 [Candidatus Binataceae bacterium]|nr:hypothetical protein [Candidatus Binataceae bacterium]
MKTKVIHEYQEGPQATARFKTTMRAILAVPHAEVLQREEEYRKQSALNPRKRGPKRKVKPSAGRAPAADA